MPQCINNSATVTLENFHVYPLWPVVECLVHHAGVAFTLDHGDLAVQKPDQIILQLADTTKVQPLLQLGGLTMEITLYACQRQAAFRLYILVVDMLYIHSRLSGNIPAFAIPGTLIADRSPTR